MKIKLASVELITSVQKHFNSDRLSLVKILGFQCVVPKDTYKIDDHIIFIRHDSVLPDLDWAIEFKKYAQRRVKPIKLRKEYSNGIIVNKNDVKDFNINWDNIGESVDEILGITKYEIVIQEENAIGPLPNFLIKTDEERWENIVDTIPYGELCDVTLKSDGTSFSCFYKIDEDRFGITSRNIEMSMEKDNKYKAQVDKLDLKNKLINYCKNNNVSLCLRGELIGKGIQSFDLNEDSKIDQTVKFFSCWLIDEMSYANKGSKFYYKNVCNELNLPVVDIIDHDIPITKELIEKYSTELEKLNGKPFEGVVIKYNNGSFKIINKYYDSKK